MIAQINRKKLVPQIVYLLPIRWKPRCLLIEWNTINIPTN